MENNSLIMRSQNANCAGCGMSIAHNLIGDALGNRVKYAIPACCAIITPHSFPYSGYKVPVVATTFAASSIVASGIKAVQTMNNEDGHVIAFAGDGGTFDIGFACLSSCAERNEDIIYFCYDNEIYGNTGAQRSSATPLGASTTTTPFGKKEHKKDIISIIIDHNIPYAATVSIGFPDDFVRKVKTAAKIKGFRFLYLLSPCVPNWKIEPFLTVKLSRLAVETGMFPLYEVYKRSEYHITYKPEKLKPLPEYLRLQKRFSKITKTAEKELTKHITAQWDRLTKMEEIFPPKELLKYL